MKRILLLLLLSLAGCKKCKICNNVKVIESWNLDPATHVWKLVYTQSFQNTFTACGSSEISKAEIPADTVTLILGGNNAEKQVIYKKCTCN